MPALTLRPAPLPWVVARRALPAVAVAVAGGAWLALIVAVAFGVDLGSGAAVWIAVAGACACVSGWMVGASESVAGAAALAIAALAAVVLAAGTGGDASAVRPAFAPRADLAPRAGVAPRARGERRAEPRSGAAAHKPTAGQLVRSYYAAIDAGDFAAAWARLSPGVQAAFGGFDAWRTGYASTLDQRVEAVEVDGAQIRHVLVARDRTRCGGTTEQRFAVTWTMAAGHATALHAVKLAGQDPAAVC